MIDAEVHFSNKKISGYHDIQQRTCVMGMNALIFWMPVQNWHGTYLHHRDTVKCLKKYILFEYLVNAIIALLWGIIAWRFLLLAKQTPTFSLLSWVSYYSFKLLKMNALKVDLWPCFLSLSMILLWQMSRRKILLDIGAHWTQIDFNIHEKFNLNFPPGEGANLNFRLVEGENLNSYPWWGCRLKNQWFLIFEQKLYFLSQCDSSIIDFFA